jgi:hypothetical protein
MKDEDDLPQGPRSPAHSDALRELGNPYACIQTYPVPEIRARTKEESAYIRELGDQYASLSIVIPGPETSVPVRAPVAQVPATASKVEFEKECRRVFRQYIPAVEKNRLRRHHLNFIARNAGRAPGIRGALLADLRKFDLGDTPGFRARFNRERNPFTEAKLREIELKINRGKK